ncbi:TIGR01459 family HAD-type hydrolase [Mesorhizobium sp.]|uniref:TIGR01459 family HAD-type hydrolase n=1 Tax=Mesorhizobium sp. TaxID=1871066 RepID=UPI0025F91237|nr:TIGR01459 family HAD-type hydrolase [Mesorhizobium sp.]
MPSPPQPSTAFPLCATWQRCRVHFIWGVVHDGEIAFPDAISTLDLLKSSGLDVCLLSNSPRRANQVAARLECMGIDPSLYGHIITSGELVFEALGDACDDWHAALGRRYFHLGQPDLAGLLWGLDRIEVDLPRSADFIVNTGTNGRQTLDDLAMLLDECALLDLPMICANPDLVVVAGDQTVLCAGTLAQRYEVLGGTVRYHGKPHSPAYRHALDLLGHERHEVLAVGDSLRTDVAGARNEGLDVVFIASGIHRAELGCIKPGEFQLSRLQELLARQSDIPTFVARHFKW